MTDRELKNLLRNLQDAPELGGDFSDANRQDNWLVVSESLGFDAVDHTSYTFKEYMDYILGRSFKLVVRPVAMGLGVFSLLFTGWIGAVNASFDSLPGDILYPVKLATERVQIQLSGSERRTRLHVEFAGRRLQELSAITNSDLEGELKQERIKSAVEKFQKELASASQELTEVKQDKPKEAAKLANAIDQGTATYKTLIEETSQNPKSSNEVKEEVTKAEQAVEESEDAVIETLVDSHERTQEAETAEDLQKKYQKTYRELNKRIALYLGRLEVVENTIQKLPEEEQVTYQERIEKARSLVRGYDDTFQETNNIFAAGGFRKAFATFDYIDKQLDQAETQIIELEIELSTLPPIMTPPSGEEEPTADPDTISNDSEETPLKEEEPVDNLTEDASSDGVE